MAMKRKRMIGVIGAGQCSARLARMAEEVGRLIARRGARLVCGGLGGVMEAAARGAKAGGGETIGILPDSNPDRANRYIDISVPTGLGYVRNALIVRAADGLIAVGGREGTLSEVAFALIEKKPLVILESWEVSPGVQGAGDPREAVDLLYKKMENGSGRG